VPPPDTAYHHPDRVRAVLLDWAGTTVDHGCFAPVSVFIAVFAARGVDITDAEARAPMGMYKRDHIAAVAAMPAVAERWRAAHGRDVTEADIDALFADAIPQQIAVIPQYAGVIAGAVETAARLRERGIFIGSCTGYTRAMMDALVPLVAAQGFAPNCIVTPDEVRSGRPAPYMAHENIARSGIYPAVAWVKVGDTEVDMVEGRNAGMWTVGVTRTGSLVGLSAEAAAALDPHALERQVTDAAGHLYNAGAHMVIDSITDLPAVLDVIDRRLAAGGRP
jgi:phosphonoacetaldehyde hydrolase